MQKHNDGIDFIRICSMFLVVIIHVLTYGGILGNLQPGTSSYYAAWYMESIAFICIDLFGMVSGYLGAQHTFKASSVLERWLQVFFYSGPLAIVMWLTGHADHTGLLAGLFPVVHNTYWYFTSYFALCFFIPFLQKAIEVINRKDAEKIVWTIVLLLSLYPCLCKYDMFSLSQGYSVGWLIALYFLGLYFGKYGFRKKISLLSAALINLLLALINCMSAIYYMNAGDQKPIMLLVYTSPTVLAGAALMLNSAVHHTFSSRSVRLIRKAAPYSFGVYLFNEEHWLRQYFLYNRLIFTTRISTWLLILIVIACVFIIYLLGTFVDFLRSKLFEMLSVREKCRQAFEWMERFLNGIHRHVIPIDREDNKRKE